MTPLISLVSGTFNRIELLQQMVQSFRDNLLDGIEYEVVLVDGGSTDGTIEWAKSQSDVVLIEDGQLLGAISAFTRGAFRASGKYVLLANDDITFRPKSILPAIVHLETNMVCGAVAFKDNRPIPGFFTTEDYKTLRMSAFINGRQGSVIYAQVGLFRKWLGDRLNWWTGEHEEMLGAGTYAGDNSLSAQIWNKGYTVDEVPECIIEDHVVRDELRQINYEKGVAKDDSNYFYKQWPQGVVVVNEPQIQQQDRRAARFLYLPIYEQGWSIQKHPIHGKRGLRDALARAKNKYGVPHIVQELDYMSIPPHQLRQVLMDLADAFKPDVILTQIQSWQPITAPMLAELRQRTGASIINWNGDQSEGGLAAPEMLAILRHVDLQLITNMDVAPIYDREGIKYQYWQIGYEMPQGDLEENVRNYFMELGRPNPFISEDQYPVVYLASLRSPERLSLAEVVRSFGGIVETPSDRHATLYNFSTSTLMYKKAKVIISDNGFHSRGFVSNRLFQALASGGGVVLQQHVDGLDELTGLKAGHHYIEWFTLTDLHNHLQMINDGSITKEQVDEIRTNGTAFVRANYSFDAQVEKLMGLIKTYLGSNQQLSQSVALKYIGRNPNSFGLGNMFPSGIRYEHNAGHLLYVKREDLPEIMRLFPDQWQQMDGD